jgi:hypothetical protein
MLYGTDMPSAERDKATDDLLSVVKAMGANLSPTIAGRVLELRDAVFIPGYDWVANLK